MLKIFWPQAITNADLYACTETKPLIVTIKRRKWKWIGYALRKSDASIVRQALEWNPQGKRKVDRPTNTWTRTTHNKLQKAGHTWNEAKQAAPNRNRWRGLSEALFKRNYTTKTYFVYFN